MGDVIISITLKDEEKITFTSSYIYLHLSERILACVMLSMSIWKVHNVNILWHSRGYNEIVHEWFFSCRGFIWTHLTLLLKRYGKKKYGLECHFMMKNAIILSHKILKRSLTAFVPLHKMEARFVFLDSINFNIV